jgi:hypothetical protein
LSSRNSFASFAVGSVPMRSRKARRTKTASEQTLAGSMLSFLSLARTHSSIFVCGDSAASLSKGVACASGAVAPLHTAMPMTAAIRSVFIQLYSGLFIHKKART